MLSNSSLIQMIGQIKNRLSTSQGLLVVILDIDIEDMNGVIERVALIHQIVNNSIPTALFTGDDDIDDSTLRSDRTLVALGEVVDARDARDPVLEPLGPPLQLAVAVEHVQDAVAAVQTLVFAAQLFVHLVVGGRVEAVHVWLGD